MSNRKPDSFDFFVPDAGEKNRNKSFKIRYFGDPLACNRGSEIVTILGLSSFPCTLRPKPKHVRARDHSAQPARQGYFKAVQG